jgi:O-antigen biosynthesis protein WbqP
MYKILNIFLALFLFILFLPLFIFVFILVKLTSKGPALHWSKRVGKENQIFLMPKFRSMEVDTPQLATHLLQDESDNYITAVGNFIRKTSLDEIPQLISVIKGDMVFVGPRPALYNQDDLIALRIDSGVHHLRPGVTGWAQINGRDSISIKEKVTLDEEYLIRKSYLFDFKIIILTVSKVLFKSDIKH